jgi:hypothetical protein
VTTPRVTLVGIVLFVCMGAVGPMATATALTPPLRSRIVATPSSVMVNTTTQLVGRHFAPRHRLIVKECGLTVWYVLQNSCDAANAITVTTNRYGTFRHTFSVETCPSPVVPPGFSQICYIGVPAFLGVDTGKLVGAAKITVTGP